MSTVELNIDAESKDALGLLLLIADRDPDLLLESFGGLLESIKGGECISCDFDRFPAPTADAGFGFLKLGDEFIVFVAALGARYRQRGFVVPGSLDGHEDSPIVA